MFIFLQAHFEYIVTLFVENKEILSGHHCQLSYRAIFVGAFNLVAVHLNFFFLTFKLEEAGSIIKHVFFIPAYF